ncbi:MAG: 2-oxo-4-hydroxy-4-carboxy-5-ureidoimidazoline decarboxylase [Alphaproteobacteria bacterium]|nr:2-oxo-4-hydroxy-4-carboxy-5-ureidoimidazoline decarboxylase [Alphaproteobacteria bacterium]
MADLNALPVPAFVDALGGVFEHSPWVAEGAAPGRPFSSVGVLHDAMCAVVRQAGEDRQLQLIRAHPDLAGKAARAGALTDASTGEQRGAGLDRLTDEELRRFERLNTAYKARFGFPFIVAVKGLDKHDILAAFETRLQHDRDRERQTALDQIARIARFRLNDLIADPPTEGPGTWDA